MGSGESKAIPPSVFSVIIEGTDSPGSGPIHRNPDAVEQLIVFPAEGGLETLYDSFQAGVLKSGDGPCLGHRPVVDGVAGDYVWQSYVQVNARARSFGSGLSNLSLIPVVDGMRMVAFYMKNRPEWVIAEQVYYLY